MFWVGLNYTLFLTYPIFIFGGFMKNVFIGGLVGILVIYSLGSTYILMNYKQRRFF